MSSVPAPPLREPVPSEYTPEERRSLRLVMPRARTLNATRMSQREKREILADRAVHDRPKTRGDCEKVSRPCPYVGCQHHLYLDVDKKGGIKLNFPALEPDELVHSCVLDLAEKGGMSLEDVGLAMNLTRERARQIESNALTVLLEEKSLREHR